MRFAKLGPDFQAAFAMAWKAYVDGTVPIGAAILDAEGQVVATGAIESGLPRVRHRRSRDTRSRTRRSTQFCRYRRIPSRHPNFTLFTRWSPVRYVSERSLWTISGMSRMRRRDRIAGATLLATRSALSGKAHSFRWTLSRDGGVQIVWHTLFSLQRFG
jgi:hypothetical protein